MYYCWRTSIFLSGVRWRGTSCVSRCCCRYLERVDVSAFASDVSRGQVMVLDHSRVGISSRKSNLTSSDFRREISRLRQNERRKKKLRALPHSQLVEGEQIKKTVVKKLWISRRFYPKFEGFVLRKSLLFVALTIFLCKTIRFKV